MRVHMYMCVRLFGCFRRPPAAETPEMSEAGRAARARHALAEISILGDGRPPRRLAGLPARGTRWQKFHF